MSFHQETIDALRVQGYLVGEPYIQAGDRSGHLFLVVNNLGMPIEWAQDLAHGRATLEDKWRLSVSKGAGR